MVDHGGACVTEQGVQGVRRGRRPGPAGQDPQPGVTVLEERVGVGDRAVGVTVEHEQRLAPSAEGHQLRAVPRDDRTEDVEQRRRVLGVVRGDPARDPHPPVVADHRGPQRRVGHRRPDRHVDIRAERLEHRAAGERHVVEPEHRPVRQLRGRRPAPPERQVPARAAAGGERVEHRGAGRLRGRALPQPGHRPVPQAVEDDEHDGQPVVDEPRLGLPVARPPTSRTCRTRAHRFASRVRRTGTVAGGTSPTQDPSSNPARIAAASSLVAGSPSSTVTS